MKVYQTNEIKNIALLGNDGSGKTTLTEALLYESGIIKRRGRITAKKYSQRLFSGRAGVWLLGLLYRLSCRVEWQKTEYHRLSGK